MSQDELFEEYNRALESSHAKSRDILRGAALSYLMTREVPEISTRLRVKFERSIKPYCDSILLKYSHPRSNDGQR